MFAAGRRPGGGPQGWRRWAFGSFCGTPIRRRTNHSIIGKYERDEVAPFIDVVKKLADALDTTVGYLLSETKQSNFLKDTAKVKRLNDLNNLPDKDKEYILYALDGLIKSAKLQAL